MKPSAGRKEPPAAKSAAAQTNANTAVKISASAGIIAALVLAVLANLSVARHYRRWDLTRGGLYTLSEPTVQTLRALEEPVQVYVLLSSDDPLGLSLRHLLEAYRAETTRLEVQFTDPDRHPAEFLAVQQRFGVGVGKTVDGRVVTDASVIVARGERPHFLTEKDLVEVEDENDLRARPRLEEALTAAIRSVLGGERPKVCVTAGHGEKSIEVGGAAGLAPLRDRLVKSNLEVVEVGSAVGADAPPSPLSSCRVLVVAGPTEKVPAEDASRWLAYLEAGGNALVVVGPVPDASDQKYLELGLDGVLGFAGVSLRDDFIFELAPDQRSTQGFGETFMPEPKPHPVTEGVIRAAERGLPVVMTVGSSLVPTGAGLAAPLPLLVTSEQAFGMADFFAWAKAPSAPARGESDHAGPLTVAFATELPKRPGSTEPHGSRLVVAASTSILYGANWQNDELRGTALFVENAISWLSARPVVLDIPKKPSFVAGLRVTEEALASIFRYVVVFIPLASILLGVAVHLRRRGSERRQAGSPKAP